MSSITRCDRCSRRLRSPEGWNAALVGGVITSLICPGCQTAEENAEAVVNEATLDYGVDEHGRQVGRPRTGSGE